MTAEKKLQELGITLPQAVAPQALYLPAKQVGNLLYVSGQIPVVDSKVLYTGQVGDVQTIESGQEAAKICAINIIAVLKAFLGDLGKVTSIVKLQVFVSSTADFDKQHIVANAASQLFVDVFGEAGKHARAAVGVAQLPLGASVEVEAIVEVK